MRECLYVSVCVGAYMTYLCMNGIDFEIVYIERCFIQGLIYSNGLQDLEKLLLCYSYNIIIVYM